MISSGATLQHMVFGTLNKVTCFWLCSNIQPPEMPDLHLFTLAWTRVLLLWKADRNLDPKSLLYCWDRCNFYHQENVPQHPKGHATPPSHSNNINCLFCCDCDSHLGRMSQPLLDSIREHVPVAIRKLCTKIISANFFLMENALIVPPILDNIYYKILLVLRCILFNYHNFMVLARSELAFHLSAPESTFIQMLSPKLCRHMECLYRLNTLH